MGMEDVYKKTNREKRLTPKRNKKHYCHYCDCCLVRDGDKCRVCGCIDYKIERFKKETNS